jgi:hypothetical protein
MELPAVTLPVRQPKMTLSSTTARAVGTIFSAKGREKFGVQATVKETPPTFEELNQNSGFVLYETTLPAFTRDPSELVINDLRDRAYVYVDEYFVGILSRENAIKSLPISSGLGTTLQILVENQGRINFQIADDYKVRKRAAPLSLQAKSSKFLLGNSGQCDLATVGGAICQGVDWLDSNRLRFRILHRHVCLSHRNSRKSRLPAA